MVKTRYFLAFLALGLSLAGLSGAQSQVQGDSNSLILRAGTFDPTLETPQLKSIPVMAASESRHGLVQYDKAASMDRKALEAAGAQILEYVPNNAYLVRWTLAAWQRIALLPGVRFAGPYDQQYRVSPALWEQTEKSGTPVPIEMMGFKGDRPENLEALVQKLAPGSRVLSADGPGRLPIVRFELAGISPAEFAARAAAFDQVMWIDRHYRVQIHNRDSVGPIQGNGESGGPPPQLTPIWDQDITGTGQIVAVADSGLDRNAQSFSQWDGGAGLNTEITDAEFLNADEVGILFPERKVVGYFVQPGALPYDHNVECGETLTGFHGTHVTGTVAADGRFPSTPTEPNMDLGDGMAPNAQILFQQLGNSETGCLDGRGGYPMYTQASNSGAGIFNGSYGSSPDGENGYFGNDFEADAASYDLEDILLIFSAGNEGPGVGTAGHPAQAKSPVSAGATLHGNDATPADFSSRGPGHDGRIKPDIMAPGVGIRSVLGNDNNDNPPPDGDSNTITIRQGTSMAAPTVSGGAALMRQYFVDGFYPTGIRNAEDSLVPTAALMKATLLNGTRTYADTPSNETGWGRIWLDNNLYFAGDDRDLRMWDLRNRYGMATGGTHEYKVRVEAGQEFRATLVWTDPPATSFSGQALINDLDLEVTGNGVTYLGNVFSGSESTSGGSRDTLNPVEQVRLTAAPPGDYTVRVRATGVPGNSGENTTRQGYALAVSSAQCDSGVSAATELTLDSDASGINLSFDAVTGADGYQVYRAEGSCETPTGPALYLGQTSGLTFSDPNTVGGFEYSYRIRGVDACGEGPVSSCKSVASQASCKLLPQFDAETVTVQTVGGNRCGVKLDWTAGQSACPGTSLKYNIYRSTNPFFNTAPGNLIASVSTASFEDIAVEPLTSYYYVVTAEDNSPGGGGPNQGNETLEILRQGIATVGDSSTPGTFTDDPDQLALVSTGNPWQVSNRRASTGALSYRNSGPVGTYPNLTCGYLTTPPINLQSTGPVLNYDAWYNIEEFWDGVIVEISTDGGQTWQDLPPDGGYPSDLRETEPSGVPINECGYPATQGAFNGVRTQFQTYTSDLSAFAGQTVQFRWVFTSDPGAEFEGFYLDNIQVTEASTPNACIAGASPQVSGPWFNADQSGHGWLVEMLDGVTAGEPDRVNAYWYVYSDQNPVWLIGTGNVEGTSATLDVAMTAGADFPPDFVSDDVELIPWGTLTFDFASETQGTASWNSLLTEFGSGSLDMVQLAPISESANSCRSGSYYNVEQSGHGFVVEVISIDGDDQIILAWYVYQNGQQVWLFGQGPLIGTQAEVPLGIFSGADFPPDFSSSDVVNTPWGTATITFTGPDSATVNWDSDTTGFADGTLDVVRLTGLKGKACQ